MGKSFLSERIASRDVQFSIGGKIRVGTKAISKKAAENPKAAALYSKALAGMISFREAEKEIYKACNMSNPFYPRNTQEFHAHPWDMNTGGMSTSLRLLELYGEQRQGDSKAKLYRFPIVFPDVQDGNLDSIVGGGLSVQGGGAETIRYSSRYEADGSRVCTHLPLVTRTETAKRKIVQHVPRKPVVRGLCVPEECEEFSFGMCKFTGKLSFYIPGIAGAGVFELHTGSTEATSQIYLRLSQAMQTCHGRLPNFTPDGRPVFWLSKERATRQYFDENGHAKMGEQWVPTLDMEIELPKVMWLKQQQAMLSPPSSREVPAAWIEGSPDIEGVLLEKTEIQRDLTDAVVSSSKEAVKATPTKLDIANGMNEMLGHAHSFEYRSHLDGWATVRFGEDWMDNCDPVHLAWSAMKDRFEGRIGQWLQFLIKVWDMKLDQELVMAYHKGKVGPLGGGATLPEYMRELSAVCADGAAVATELMQAYLEKGVASK